MTNERFAQLRLVLQKHGLTVTRESSDRTMEWFRVTRIDGKTRLFTPKDLELLARRRARWAGLRLGQSLIGGTT